MEEGDKRKRVKKNGGTPHACLFDALGLPPPVIARNQPAPRFTVFGIVFWLPDRPLASSSHAGEPHSDFSWPLSPVTAAGPPGNYTLFRSSEQKFCRMLYTMAGWMGKHKTAWIGRRLPWAKSNGLSASVVISPIFSSSFAPSAVKFFSCLYLCALCIFA
jgi:hypothetical protein